LHLLFKIHALLATALLTACASNAAVPPPGDLSDDPKVGAFIDKMANEHAFDRQHLKTLFDGVTWRDSILEAIARPAEAKPWFDYRPIFLTESRIEGGVEFWRKHTDILKRVEAAYDVDAQIIVAIIGVETRYGGNTGSYPVLDALSTLAFGYPPRSEFFTKELAQFLILTREEKVDVKEAKGSYAGAMGMGQFIPSSYRAYAVDFDGDGTRDLWGSMDDVLGSVANYFKRHGWQRGAPVAVRAEVDGTPTDALLKEGLKPAHPLSYYTGVGFKPAGTVDADTQVALLALEQKDGPEYWLTMNNFYVITRYNRSPLYAMAVYQLSEAIRDAYEKAGDHP
jgi:membrane-bound lytic murein transglycosylase B